MRVIKITFYTSLVFIMMIGTMQTSFAQTVTINGQLVQVKPALNNTFIATVNPVGNYNGMVYHLDSVFNVINSFSVQNENYTALPSPPQGDLGYQKVPAKLVTFNNTLFYSTSRVITGGNVATLYKDSIDIVKLINTNFVDLIDLNSICYALFSVGSDTWVGNDTISKVAYVGGLLTNAIAIVDSNAISSSDSGVTYIVYRDVNFKLADMSFLQNGNILLKAISTTLNQTRFIELDGVNPTIGGIQDSLNIIRDTTINGPADMVNLPNGNFMTFSNRGGKATICIFDSNWNLISTGYRFTGPLGSSDLGKSMLQIFDDKVFITSYRITLSEKGNIIEYLFVDRFSDGESTIFGSNGIRYGYTEFGADSVVFGKQSFLPDASLMLTVKDTDIAVTGAYSYVERDSGTDSLVPSTENICYVKFANASTYTSIGVGNWIPSATIAKWIQAPVTQLSFHGWFLEYDSLTSEYYTYGQTVKSTETFSVYTHKKFVKIILTTDPVDTAVIVVPPVNNAPWHSLSATTFEDTLTLNKSHFVGGATDADGDTVTYYATGLPAGKTIDSLTGIISGIPTVTPGLYPITVFATDRKGGNTPKNHTIRVSLRHYTSLENQEILQLEIYPNPAQEVIYLRNVIVQQYVVYSASGKLVMKGNGNRISVSHLAAGSYQLLVIDKDDRQYSQTVVVE